MRYIKVVLLVFLVPFCAFSQNATSVLTSENWPEESTIYVKKDFSKKTINTFCYLKSPVSLDSLVSGFSLAGFSQNKILDRVAFGLADAYAQGLTAFKVINSSSSSKKLVLDLKQQRCDMASLYRLESDNLNFLQNIERSTPLYDRHLPYTNFSLGFQIAAHDTAIFVLATERYTGLHDFGLLLLDKKTFVKTAESDKWLILVHSGFYISLLFIMLWIGIANKRKEMLYFGLYLLMYIFMLLGVARFLDGFPPFFQTGLSSSNIVTLCIFMVNVFYYPFLLSYIRKRIDLKRYIFVVSWFIIGLNLGLCTLLFVPSVYYHFVNPLITYGLQFCLLLNAIWILYMALHFFHKTKLSFLLLLTAPTSGSILLILIADRLSWLSYENLPQVTFYCNSAVILMMYGLLIKQFQDELKEQDVLKNKLSEQRKASEEIRLYEVQQIGRNLHDQLGNTLASALGFLRLKESDKEQTQILIKKAITETRFISHNLVMEYEGVFSENLEDLVERFNDFSEINFHFYDLGKGAFDELSVVLKQNLFIMIQELLTNIIKHSKADNAFVQLFQREKMLEIAIEDDGTGLGKTTNAGIGLENIKKRAELMNISVTMESTAAGLGTIIEIANEK